MWRECWSGKVSLCNHHRKDLWGRNHQDQDIHMVLKSLPPNSSLVTWKKIVITQQRNQKTLWLVTEISITGWEADGNCMPSERTQHNQSSILTESNHEEISNESTVQNGLLKKWRILVFKVQSHERWRKAKEMFHF